MLDFAHVCAVEADGVGAVVLVAVHVHVLLVAFLRLDVLDEVESHAFAAVRSGVVFRRGLGASHVQGPVVVRVFVILYAVTCFIPFFLSHFLFVLSHQLPLREVFLVLLIVQHLVARVDLLHAEFCLVVVVCDVDIVVVHIQAGRVRVVVVNERSFWLDVVPDVLPVLVDDVVGVLEVAWRGLSHMAGIIVELCLLLGLQLERLLLLLLAVLRGIAVLFAFSFTLPFLAVVRCALRPRQMRKRNIRKAKRERKLEI